MTIDRRMILRHYYPLFLVLFEFLLGEDTLANSKQAKKRIRQAEKSRSHNASRKSEMRTYIKSVLKAVEEKDSGKAAKLYRLASSMLDKLARINIITKNKAARHKSRLNAKIKAISA